MTFGNAPMLWILLATVLTLAAFFYWAWRRRQRDILLFVRSRLLAELTVGLSSVRRKIRLLLLVAGVAAVMFALARPRWGVTYEELRQHGLDIIVAVDTSRSMMAEDVPPNRLARAKLAALELMPLAKRDRLGLIAFAGTAFLQCPLTLDEEAFRQSVDVLDVGLIPQGGTALAEALAVAEKTFENDEQNVKVMVLITDGEDHEEGALAAVQKAAQQGIRVFTIGVGTTEGDMLHLKDQNEPFVKDPEGNVVKSRLNETLLRKLAEAGHGFYLPLRGAKVMDTLYERGLAPLFGLAGGKLSDRAEKNAPRVLKHYSERFAWFLALAVILLLIELFLPERRVVRKPDKSIAKSGAPELGKLAAALWLAGLALPAAASPASALRSYQDGHYQTSLLEYKRLLDKHPQDPRLNYNAGAAAYQAKRYDEALPLFNEALKSPDIALQQRSYYNLGNTLFRAGQQAQEPPAIKEHWENALQNYDSALKLNPQDANAKFNRDLVKKKLEELEQEQKDKQDSKDQQDQKDQKDQQDKQDKQDQKEDKKEDQKDGKGEDKQDPSKPQDKQDSKPEDNPSKGTNQQDQAQSPKPDEGKEPPDQNPPPPKPEGADQKKPDPKEGDSTPKPAPGTQGDQKTPPGEAANAATLPVGVMSKEQAERLLDALKHEEKALRFQPVQPQKNRPRSFKDW